MQKMSTFVTVMHDVGICIESRNFFGHDAVHISL